jgi:cytochrome c
VQPGQNRIGPHLSGIVGRKPGSVEGVRYSKGLSAIEPNWDAASLDAYLANPRGVAPGTTMSVSVPNAADRGSIVAYLQGLTAAN